MNLKTSFALAIVFMVLGTFAVFDPLHWKEKKEEGKERDGHVVWLKDTKLDSLVLHARDIRIGFSCEGKEGCSVDGNGDWKILEPAQDMADQSNMGAFLSSLKNLLPVEQSDVEAGASLAEYGLDKPQSMLEYTIHGQKTPQYIKIGNPSAIGPNVYIYSSASPSKLYLVANNFHEQVKKDLFYWRNKKIFRDIISYDVQSLSWKNSAGKYFSFSYQNNQWQMKSPLDVKANQVMLDGLLNTLLYLQATSIELEKKDAPESKKILRGKPSLVLTLEAKGQKEELQFFKKTKDKREKNPREQLYVSSNKKPTLFVVEASSLERFEKDLQELRNRHLLTAMDKNAVASAEFNFMRDKKRIAFQRDGADWKRADGEALKELSQSRIKNFVDSLSLADVKRIDLAKTSAWSAIPELELVLKDAAKKELAKMHFVLVNKKYALTEGELKGELRVLDDNFLKVLPVRVSDFEEANNKQVITSEKEDKEHEAEHGH